MRTDRRGVLCAALSLTISTFTAAVAAAQAVFAGTGGPAGPGLGIGRMIAPYAIVHADDWVQFGGELELRDILPDGPAAGRVQEGDILVAVDGALITTRAGSTRLLRAPSGQPVRLTLRRSGVEHDVVVVPVGAAEASSSPTVETPIPLPAARYSAAAPPHARGRLGIGLSCHCTMQTTADGVEHWSFVEPPEVGGVQTGGPAERAGVRVGDIIERIDNVAITTQAGGERWSAVASGARVRLGLRRGAARLEVEMVAASR